MRHYLLYIVIFSFLVSCEDVIEVETPSEAPRLSVDALLRINEEEPITKAIIKVSETSSFFKENTPIKVSEMTITNLDQQNTTTNPNQIIFTLIEPGVYEAIKRTTFFTEGRLQLSIKYNNQTYTANTSYVPAVPITNLEQGNGTLFEGNETEIILTFVDEDNRDDFYLFDFDFNEYLVSEDEFYQGQPFKFSYFYNDDVKAGMHVNVSILGVNEDFFNYMNLLIIQSGGAQGPFQTPVATVKGNIINTNNNGSLDTTENTNNFALGYFAVCQTYSSSLTIE
ncbi:DUF4249 family protein [uncultured Maribacter sp.]|uniref:DUF4249 family protein n=1 Tax=uncultured Maribacter sp. TaxID=431308 RepID=UPI00260DCE85|nr:DUF4249 family protein [uncultured Maribacter sp.]